METLPPIGLAGFLATTLLPALSKAKAKANRAKCSNNLGQIGKAWNGFAATHGEFPWMLIGREAEAVYSNQPRGRSGATWKGEEPLHIKDRMLKGGKWPWATDIEMMWMPVGDDLKTIKTLHSPCDPGIKENNRKEYALEISTKKGNDRGIFAGDGKVNYNSQSYAVHKGSSAQDGSTILALTRNWVGADSFAADCSKLLPVQSIDVNQNRQYDDAPAGMDRAQKRAPTDSVYRHPSGQILYSNIMNEGQAESNPWDRYLCVGHNDKMYGKTKIPSVGFVGPDVDAKVTFAGGDQKCYSVESMVMAGLNADQGQLARSEGSTTLMNDEQFKESVRTHRDAKTSWIFPLEVLSQPHQAVRP